MKKSGKINISDVDNIISGNVNITILHKDKVMKTINIHNRGTVDICRYLRDAIAGDYVIVERPGVIAACVKGAGDTLIDLGTANLLNNPKKSDVEDDDNASTCTLTFLIPSNVISSGAPIAGFKLYSLKSKTLYAQVSLDEEDWIEVTPGVNLKVTWTLIVKTNVV